MEDDANVKANMEFMKSITSIIELYGNKTKLNEEEALAYRQALQVYQKIMKSMENGLDNERQTD